MFAITPNAICLIVLSSCVAIAMSTSCNSCGSLCTKACGTRIFKACCYNYMRKRSDTYPNEVPGVKLELLMVVPELMQKYQKPFPELFDKSVDTKKIEDEPEYYRSTDELIPNDW